MFYCLTEDAASDAAPGGFTERLRRREREDVTEAPRQEQTR